MNKSQSSQRRVDSRASDVITQSKTSNMSEGVKSMRKVDSHASDVITDWLQKYYLTKLFDKSVVNVDKQSQICGIDVLAINYLDKETSQREIEEQFLIDINSCDAHVTSLSNITQQEIEKIFLIDVKAQLNYINNPTNTFALELNFKNRRGVIVDGWGQLVTTRYTMNGVNNNGWALQPNTNNSYYLFTWIHECKVSDKKSVDGRVFATAKQYLIDVNQIDKVEVVLVKRERVREWLSSLNLDIKETCDMMRRTHTHRVDVRGGKYNNKLAWFVFSDRLAEEPIVLVVPKSRYIELCDWYGFVTKDKIERLRGTL